MLTKNIKLLYLEDFFSAIRFYSPILVIYFAHVTGSYTLAMTLIAADSFFSGIWELPTGVFSDFFDRKRTLSISIFAGILGVCIWALGQNFWVLLLGTFFTGLSGALGSGNDEAFLYESLKELGKEDEYHHYYSRSSFYQLVAFGSAAFIGGFLATISLSLVFWLSAFVRIFALVTSFFIKKPPFIKQEKRNPYHHLWESIKEFLHNPKLRLLSLSNAWSNAITESTFQFAPVFVSSIWPIWAVGLMRSGNNFANAFSYFISGKVIKRFRALRALIGQFIVSRIILIITYLFPTFFSPFLLISTSLVYGIGQVSQKALLQQEFTDHQRATLSSLDALLGRIFFTVISILIGFFADIVGPREILLIGEFALIPLLFIFWRLFLHHQKSTNSF